MSHKDEVITFKVDGALAEQLRLIPNRSEFIRQAVQQALKYECPLCHGTGTLTANQMKHWEAFTRHHHVETCDVCGESFLACDDHPEEHRDAESAAPDDGSNHGVDHVADHGSHAH
ncbi:MAG: ribbon-helix-helix domain-containing protein [Alkalispirochaeta sp.]